MQRPEVWQGPHFTVAQAAAYCGYARATLEKKLQGYDLPRTGPSRNRLPREALDLWMNNPEYFKRAPARGRRRTPCAVSV